MNELPSDAISVFQPDLTDTPLDGAGLRRPMSWIRRVCRKLCEPWLRRQSMVNRVVLDRISSYHTELNAHEQALSDIRAGVAHLTVTSEQSQQRIAELISATDTRAAVAHLTATSEQSQQRIAELTSATEHANQRAANLETTVAQYGNYLADIWKWQADVQQGLHNIGTALEELWTHQKQQADRSEDQRGSDAEPFRDMIIPYLHALHALDKRVTELTDTRPMRVTSPTEPEAA